VPRTAHLPWSVHKRDSPGRLGEHPGAGSGSERLGQVAMNLRFGCAPPCATAERGQHCVRGQERARPTLTAGTLLVRP
jgi:hypothetical protein